MCSEPRVDKCRYQASSLCLSLHYGIADSGGLKITLCGLELLLQSGTKGTLSVRLGWRRLRLAADCKERCRTVASFGSLFLV